MNLKLNNKTAETAYNVYVTKENDTVKKLLDSGINLDNLYNIYLQNDQIIFYKKD